jgi:hypothetical protein
MQHARRAGFSKAGLLRQAPGKVAPESPLQEKNMADYEFSELTQELWISPVAKVVKGSRFSFRVTVVVE